MGFSQVKIQAKPGELFDLSELGAIILLKENKVIVEFVMPDQTRHADYREIDIRKGDEISYVNGKKIQSTVELEDLYKKTKIGDEIKLGIKRNENLGLITFKKADPESLPKRKMMKMTVKESDFSGEAKEVEINGKKYNAKDGKVVIDDKEMTIEELMETEGVDADSNDKNKQ
jgi:PDZ domain-containing secreted protein